MLSLQAVNRVLGNCSEFYEEQTRRLLDLGVDARSRAVSHVAYRTETLPEYLDIRRQLEPWCSANVENVWGGRPISKLLLQTPLDLAPNSFTRLVELIPPPHPDVYQRVYKLGLEHLGIVLGEIFAEFAMDHILAKRFASDTQVASRELAMDPPNNAGACTCNLSCVYTHMLCWRNPTHPLSVEYNPRAGVEKLGMVTEPSRAR